MRCPTCAAEIEANADSCPACKAALSPPTSSAESGATESRPDRSGTSDSHIRSGTVIADRYYIELLLNEVRLAREITHPNVCGLFDVGEISGHHFLSMEYVEGEDLASLLRRIGRLPKDKAFTIGLEICNGLEAAHARGILHRDLKPANLMIDATGHTKIMDFGLAILSQSSEGQTLIAGTQSTWRPNNARAMRPFKPTSMRSGSYCISCSRDARSRQTCSAARTRQRALQSPLRSPMTSIRRSSA